MKNPLPPKQDDCSLEFACIGCNRTTQALSWGRCGLIAYGACNSVVLYKPNIKGSAGKVLHVLNGHKARVNCVHWLSDKSSEDENGLEIISGSSDKDVILWEGRNGKWQLKQVLSGHTKMVCSLASASYNVDEKHSFFVSAGADFSLKLWNRCDNTDFQCSQTISFGNGFAYTVAMSCLPQSNNMIVACGCDDNSIRLYKLQENQLQLVLTLTGHKDCIRCLSFTNTSGGELLLASGSQDSYIRLWKIGSCRTKEEEDNNDMLALQEQSFMTPTKQFSVVLESVLIGHEGWILGVSWSSCNVPWPSLLSASMDRTMILWEYDEENKVWIDTARMGEVGGNTLGYYGCAYGPDDMNVIAHGYQGAFQMWTKELNEESSKWKPEITISGHFGEIEDFDWDPEGQFLITASTDQTTRLFTQWKREHFESTWHEIARPQVHGYDMKAIVMLDRYKYASGAQEKVARVFSAPQSFYDTFSCIANIQADGKAVNLPVGATVPVLGLSNKAVFKDDIQSWSQPSGESSQIKKSPFVDEPALFNPTLINEPPVEDVLLQNTLWPEIQKLYGHGFEVFTLASTSDGTVLASACKASKPEYADILIWDTSTWKLIDQLSSHTLTVTQLCFSKTGQYLLSVSRDRTWALHQRAEDNHLKYMLAQKTDKTNCVHTRIIWACDWLGDEYFATVSRDKKAIVWGLNDSQWAVCKDTLNVGESATAVSVYNRKHTVKGYIIAIGLESGGINIYTWLNDEGPSAWNLILNVDRSLCPVLQVKRLHWRHSSNVNTEDLWELGACSSDHSFRILKFNSILFE